MTASVPCTRAGCVSEHRACRPKLAVMHTRCPRPYPEYHACYHPIQNRARARILTLTRTLTLTLPGVPRVLLEAGRRAQHLRQGEPRAEQEQQEAQRPARRGRRLGAELQLDVLERRAAVVRGSRRGGWGCVAAAWRRAVRLTARVDQDAHVARCSFVRVHRHRTHGAGLIGRTAAPCGAVTGVWLLWLAVWLLAAWGRP